MERSSKVGDSRCGLTVGQVVCVMRKILRVYLCHFTMLSCVVTRGAVCVRMVRACGRSGRRALTAAPATPHSLSIQRALTNDRLPLLLKVFPKRDDLVKIWDLDGFSEKSESH